MKSFLKGVHKVILFMQGISGVVLTFVIVLTTADVLLRIFGHPVPGAVEITAMCGGIVIGFTVPMTSWMKGHIAVDFLLNSWPSRVRNTVETITRCVGIVMFIFIGVNMIRIGRGFQIANEVTGTLELPMYPVVYGIAGGLFALSVVLFCDIVKIYGGEVHE
ncbi:MAG: TRAP transporter small permease [Syntrophorhabdus sp.]|nr:TRAP transporter small permease [Syntrophorhabdus sp.]